MERMEAVVRPASCGASLMSELNTRSWKLRGAGSLAREPPGPLAQSLLERQLELSANDRK